MRRRRMTIADRLGSLALAVRRELRTKPETTDGHAERSVRVGACLLAAQALMTADRWDDWVAGVNGLTDAASREHIAAVKAHRERLAARAGPLPCFLPADQSLIVYKDTRCSTERPFAVIGHVDGGFHVAVLHSDHLSETAKPATWAGVPTILGVFGEGHFREEVWAWEFASAGALEALREAVPEHAST